MSDDEKTTSPAKNEPFEAANTEAEVTAVESSETAQSEGNTELEAVTEVDMNTEPETDTSTELTAEPDESDEAPKADAVSATDETVCMPETTEDTIAAVKPNTTEPESAPAQSAAPLPTPEPEVNQFSAGIPVLEDVSTTVSDTQNIPRFLTREQYEQIGDDPDPLPAGFEVIDGGSAASEPLPVISAQDVATRAEAETPVEQKPSATQNIARAGAAVADAAASVGSMLATGMGAVREVNAAKRAHSEAREQLDELSRVIGENEDELNHRRDVERRYDELFEQQTQRREKALEVVTSTKAAQEAIASAMGDLKSQLDQMKEEDSATEKRLKAVVEEAEAKESAAREGANRLVRRVTDAQRALDAAKQRRDEQVAAAQAEIDAAQTRLRALREEFAGIQRNPSANSAAYSVRRGQLQTDISDATELLRRAQSELPRVTAEGNQAIADAEAILAQANKPIDEARSAFREVSDATAAARDALDEAREDAESRQKALRTQINEKEKARREQEKAQQNAQAEADDAAFMLQDMQDVHAHPEITEQLAARIASDRAYRAEQLQKVESLAETEQSIRERTRTSRLRFTGALVVVILFVILLVLLWNVLTSGN